MHPSESSLPPLRLVWRGQIVTLNNVAPDRTLLEVLREDLRCTAVKEGCASGDCGACTVAVGTPDEAGGLEITAINSCIRLAHSVQGQAVWTAADIAGPDGTLHPAQQAMVACHGSQCGFCTPGFVMSLFALYHGHESEPLSRDEAQHALSGNLCRCTGYRPILDAAQAMYQWPTPPLNEAEILQKLELLTLDRLAQEADLGSESHTAKSFYAQPHTQVDALAWRAAHPQALVVAGATDVGLWLTKRHQRFAQLIDVTRVAELRRVARSDGVLRIGAAVTLTQAFAALARDWPTLAPFFDRFAGLPVRQSGTLGGNVANGSPIGDSMPVLIALGAHVVLGSVRGERRLPVEDFYLGYRQTALAADELLLRIELPLPQPGEIVHADKISKRFEDDISAVCLAVQLRREGERITHARVGAGGVAAVPARARRTEAALTGQPWSEASFEAAAQMLAQEFSPISDMRASAAYRQLVLGNALRRMWRTLQTEREPSLHELMPSEGAP